MRSKRLPSGRVVKKRDLQSLIGVFTHPNKVVKSSRVFLHRLIDLSNDTKDPEHFRHLNLEDIEW